MYNNIINHETNGYVIIVKNGFACRWEGSSNMNVSSDVSIEGMGPGKYRNHVMNKLIYDYKLYLTSLACTGYSWIDKHDIMKRNYETQKMAKFGGWQ